MTRQPSKPQKKQISKREPLQKASLAENRRTGHAKKALDEARTRQEEVKAKTNPSPPEIGGRKGPDPARYGDWEAKGIASDF
jgi:hypothetical protein